MRSAIAGLGLLSLLLAPACAPPVPPPAVAPPKGHSLLRGIARDQAEAAAGRTAVAGPEASKVTFERMARYPEPGWHTPRAIAYAPGDGLVTFLQSESQSDQMALFAFDPATRTSRVLVRASDLLAQAAPLSREEELRRERQRQKAQGITDYRWAAKAPVMVIPLGGDLFLRGKDGAITRLTESREAELDPQLCPSGEKVAYVRGSELYVMDVATRKETALTRGAPEGVTRGASDFVGQEEFGEESGFWWSPACDRIAYLEVDERAVGTVPVMGYRDGKPDLMMQRYPLAGGANPSVRAGIVDLGTLRTTWLRREGEPEAPPLRAAASKRGAGSAGGKATDGASKATDGASKAGAPPEGGGPPAGGERYLGRFRWSPSGAELWLQELRRDQKSLSVVRVDPKRGVSKVAWTETSATWLDFGDLRLLEKTPRAVWTDVVGGHVHLALRDTGPGTAVTQLTSGDWDVTALHVIDEERGRVLFTGTVDGPLQRHLYAVPLAGGPPQRLTVEPGTHEAHPSHLGRGFVDLHSAIDRLPRAEVRGEDGAVLGALPAPADPDLADLALRPAELVDVPGAGGVVLHGALLKPRTLEPGRRYPVVVMVYGGPTAQLVTNAWAPRLLWQHLADRGFVVFQLDNRGSAGRGPGFEGALFKKAGEVELADQLAGVDWLRAQPFVAPERVGIYGHSYGGFMAALAMLRAPDRFAVGIAGSPVTDWRLYDTGYTERYMETPAGNPAGYDGADLARLAPNLKGKLLLIHALMDENVHFENTAHLIDAFIAADKPFDLLIFPGERHGYRSPAAKRYAMHRVVDYLVEHLEREERAAARRLGPRAGREGRRCLRRPDGARRRQLDRARREHHGGP